jgi:hypothetical protein
MAPTHHVRPGVIGLPNRTHLDDAVRGLPYSPPAAGELVVGAFRRRLTLNSGRFALIDNGLGFALVPWTSALDRHLGPSCRRRRRGERRDRVEFRM